MNTRQLTPFYAAETEILVTQEKIEKRLRRDKRCAQIGEGYSGFDSESLDEEFENPYRMIAYDQYIAKDMDAPEDLKKKIFEADEDHRRRKAHTM